MNHYTDNFKIEDLVKILVQDTLEETEGPKLGKMQFFKKVIYENEDFLKSLEMAKMLVKAPFLLEV